MMVLPTTSLPRLLRITLLAWLAAATLPTSTNGFPKDCAYTQIDLAFVVDTSGSILQDQWPKVIDFMNRSTFDMTVGPDDIRYGAPTPPPPQAPPHARMHCLHTHKIMFTFRVLHCMIKR